MNKRRGISLIVLVITILVMIILAGVVVVSLQKNNPIEKAKEATKLTNYNTLKETLGVYIASEIANGNTNLNYIAEEEIKKIFHDSYSGYEGKLEVKEGKLYMRNIAAGDEDCLDAYIGVKLDTKNKGSRVLITTQCTVENGYIVMPPVKKINENNETKYPHVYGGFLNMKAGKYQVVIEGENVDRLVFKAYNNNYKPSPETEIYEVKVISSTNTKVVVNITIPKDTVNFEFVSFNETIKLNPVTIKIKDGIYIDKI